MQEMEPVPAPQKRRQEEVVLESPKRQRVSPQRTAADDTSQVAARKRPTSYDVVTSTPARKITNVSTFVSHFHTVDQLDLNFFLVARSWVAQHSVMS